MLLVAMHHHDSSTKCPRWPSYSWTCPQLKIVLGKGHATPGTRDKLNRDPGRFPGDHNSLALRWNRHMASLLATHLGLFHKRACRPFHLLVFGDYLLVVLD